MTNTLCDIFSPKDRMQLFSQKVTGHSVAAVLGLRLDRRPFI